MLFMIPLISWEAQTIWMEKTIPLVFDQNLISLKNSPAPELPILFPIIWSFFGNFLIFNTNTLEEYF